MKLLAFAMAALVLIAPDAFADAGKDREEIGRLVTAKGSVVWLITGDSITHGAKHTRGWRSYPEIVAERIRWELGRVNDVVINTGISGHCVTDILRDYQNRVGRFTPQVVSVNIGMNDCVRAKPADFEDNLKKLVQKIRADKAIPILLTTNTTLPSSNRAQKLPPFIDAVRAAAAAEGAILVDNYAVWEKNAQPDWFNDEIHPNGIGHLELAREFLRAIALDEGGKSTDCLKVKPTKK